MAPGFGSVAVADVDGDGDVDIVSSSSGDGRIAWHENLLPQPDDRNLDGVIDVQDLDILCAALEGGTAIRDELEGFWSRQNTGPGDANFDHLFDSSDLVSVFQRGKYETKAPASWNDGDWNCDGLFDTADLVAAFQRGWYESGPLNAASTREIRD